MWLSGFQGWGGGGALGERLGANLIDNSTPGPVLLGCETE